MEWAWTGEKYDPNALPSRTGNAKTTVLTAWNLKELGTKPMEAAKPVNAAKRARTEPAEPISEPKQKWIRQDVNMGEKPGWLLLITDNQALSNILNASETYKGDDTVVQNSLACTTDLLSDIVSDGWDTREASHDYILWRPRELNTIADYFASP